MLKPTWNFTSNRPRHLQAWLRGRAIRRVGDVSIPFDQAVGSSLSRR